MSEENLDTEDSVSPNFEYEEDIIDYAECTYALIDSFDAFISVKDEKPYLVYQNKNNFQLEVLKILKNKYKLVTSVEGHASRITCLKYYYNEKKGIEYLISTDYDGQIMITNITKDYKKESSYKTNYDNGRISCGLMIFNLYEEKHEDIKNGLILISNKTNYVSRDEYTPILSYILDNGFLKLNKEVLTTNLSNTSYMLYWFNKKLKKDYIIDFGNKVVDVVRISQNELYASFTTILDTWYHCGFIYNDETNKTDLLFISSIKSMVFVFDLYSKTNVKVIKTSAKIERLYNIIQWNKNYILVSNATAPDLKVIDIKTQKCVGNVFISHDDDFRCIRKIKHPKFGYCIMTGGDDDIIKLYKPKCITI
jgi:hypothetical protein